jgi:chromosome segregation ATPase
MGKFVGVCVVLFVLAVGYVVLTQGPEMSGLIAAFRSQPMAQQIAWAVIVLVPLVMLPFAVWLWDRLLRQRQNAAALESRLDGVRARAKDLTKAQAEVDADVQHLTLTDPEDAVAALQRRVSEAERFAQIQQSRNETVDLETRVAAIHDQQQKLKDRLAPVLDTRRNIEQLFAELDSRQRDIERALAEVASGDDGTALELRLKNLTEFARQGDARCDQIENASKTIATLSEVCAELRTRLVPFASADDGITIRVRQLGEDRDQLAANLDALERTPQGPLSERVQQLAGDKKRLDDGISHLSAQFCKLTTLRKDVAGLFGAFDRALSTLSVGKNGNGASDIDTRIDALTHFIDETQSQFDEIERRVVTFDQLQTRLGDLQSRLVPLESDETGVVKLIEELQSTREKLVVKIRRIEGGEEGDLAARVKSFAEAKRDLEDRVASLADQFTKLSTIRKDLAGLFDKLSSAVSASAN